MCLVLVLVLALVSSGSSLICPLVRLSSASLSVRLGRPLSRPFPICVPGGSWLSPSWPSLRTRREWGGSPPPFFCASLPKRKARGERLASGRCPASRPLRGGAVFAAGPSRLPARTEPGTALKKGKGGKDRDVPCFSAGLPIIPPKSLSRRRSCLPMETP